MSFHDFDATSAKTRAEQLVEKDPDGSKQLEKVSEHSPGPVKDDELLARSLEFPNKFTAEGGLNEELFQDAFKKGASAQRLPDGWDTHATDVHTRFEARAQARRDGSDGRTGDPENLYVGAFHMTASELRACKLDGDTIARVRVYDAGDKAEDALHADVIVDASGLAKPKRKELRLRLMALAEQRGLYVPPALPAEHRARAEGTQCTLHFLETQLPGE
jgi:hypothetical protein